MRREVGPWIFLLLAGCLGASPSSTLPLERTLEPSPLSCLQGWGCNALVSDGKSNSNEPGVAVNPHDPRHVVVGSNDYSDVIHGPWCGYALTRDGGLTWKHGLLPGFPGDTSGSSSPLSAFLYCGDPALAFDGAHLYYAGIAFHPPPLYNVALFVAKSFDGGETWPQITLIRPGISTLDFNDKEWIAIDPKSSTIYLTWTIFSFLPVDTSLIAPDPLAKGTIQLSKSTDGGRTWSPPLTLSRELDNQGSIPKVGPDGTLYVVFQEYGRDGKVRNVLRLSKDGGKSFGEPTVISEVHPIPSPLPNATFRTNSLPSFDVDPKSGALFVVWADNRSGSSDILFTRSLDSGRTWTPPRVVTNVTLHDQFLPTVAVGENSTLYVLYLDRRSDPENRRFEAWISRSIDGGETWSDFRISDVPSDDLAVPSRDMLGRTRPSFIGDYLGLASLPGGGVVAVYPDLRRADAAHHVDLLSSFLR